MKIKQISAREILDSRGWPTIECELELDAGHVVKASVPSGASVGTYEAVELRDADPKRYNGKGVLRAIENIKKTIAPALIGRAPDIQECDKIMCDYDGTQNKAKLGANAILAVSLTVCRAQAFCQNMEVFELLSHIFKIGQPAMPSVMFNIINGGAHADTDLCFQEFMIMPTGVERFADGLRRVVLIYYELKTLLRDAGYATGIGDEGGFAPKLKGSKQIPEREALDFLVRAVVNAGFEPGRDILFCLDVAANHFYDTNKKVYRLHEKELSALQMVDVYKELIADYPICSIEDGLSESDWDGWRSATQELGQKVQLVGDDIFVTNPTLIKKGIEQKVANAVLIKPNQIGTVTQAAQAVMLGKGHAYKTVVSHRSGETTDFFISDFVVGMAARQFKAGAPVRGERVVKYNRLLEIEDAIF